MSAIFLPRRWRHQPPAGARVVAPRWAQKAVYAFDFAEGFRANNGPSNLVPAPAPLGGWSTANYAQSFRSVGAAGVGTRGDAQNFYASFGATRYLDDIILPGDPWAMLTVLEDVSYVNQGSTLNGIYSFGTPGTSNVHYLSVTSSTLRWRAVNAGERSASAPSERVWAIVNGRDAAGNHWLWCNGRLLISGSGITNNIANGSSSPCSFFGGNTSTNLNGTILLHALWKENPERFGAELSENPWQIFRAPSHRIWFDVGASSGTTYNDSLTESATLGDGLDPIASFFASYAESVAAGDSAANAQAHAAAVSEGVTAGDSADSAQTMPASVGEGVTTGDSVAGDVVPAGSFNETRTESTTVEDGYVSTQAHAEGLSESLGLADSYAVTGGAEVVERRRGAPIGPPLRTWRYAARIGGRMVYADTRQALQAAIADFEVSVPSRAEKKAQKAGKVVVRRLPKVQVVEAPAEERIEVQAQAQAANDRIAAEYLSALQAQIAIRAAMERDDMEAMIALDFL